MRTRYIPDGVMVYKYKEANDAVSDIELRDWFAGMMLQGMLADSELIGDHEIFAYDAYKFADAMLEAREYKL